MIRAAMPHLPHPSQASGQPLPRLRYLGLGLQGHSNPSPKGSGFLLGGSQANSVCQGFMGLVRGLVF
jgi:hypothetical protein